MKQLPITTAEVWAVPAEQLNEALSKLGNGNWIVCGTATKDVIDFDASPFFDDADGMLNNKYALRSAITAAGYYFENPMGSRPVPDDYDDWDYGNNAYKNWQAAQHNVIEKLVIIRKV